MKIICEYEKDDFGFVVLQYEPHARTIWFGHGGPKRVNLPYVIQVISYQKNKSGDYVYRGVYYGGAAVYFSNKPITSLDQEIATSWFSTHDFEELGFICTPHNKDDSRFHTLNELVLFVSGLLWETSGYYNSDWKYTTSEEILNSEVWRTATMPLQGILSFFARIPDDLWPIVRDALDDDFEVWTELMTNRQNFRGQLVSLPLIKKDVLPRRMRRVSGIKFTEGA